MKYGTLWIRSMDHQKSRQGKTKGLPNLELEEDTKYQMEG
jgi:hypothetical protein